MPRLIPTGIRTRGASSVIKWLLLGIALLLASPAQSYTLEAKAKSEKLLHEARRLIVDALPEDREYAQDLLIESIRVSPHHVDAYAELSRFILWQVSMRYLKPFRLAQAAELARHVKEMAPERPLGNYLICEMMVALGQSEKALELFESTRSQYPKHPDTYAFESRFFSESNPERSIDAAMNALRSGVSMDALSPAITVAFEAQSKILNESLSNNLSSFAQIYPDRWIWHRAAQSYTEEKNFESARDAYQEAIRLGNTIESRLHLGILYYESLGKPELAKQELQTLLTYLESKSRSRPVAHSLVQSHLSIAHLSTGHVKEATESSTKVFQTTPNEIAMLASLIDEFEKHDQLASLEPGLVELTRLNPLLDFVHIILAQVATRRKDHSQAEHHLSNAIAVNPDRDDLYAARALSRYEQKNYEFALADFDRAIERGPQQGAHHYNRACMLSMLGRTDEALTSLKEAILIDSSFAELAAADGDLAPLRATQSLRSQLVRLGVLDRERQPQAVQKSLTVDSN